MKSRQFDLNSPMFDQGSKRSRAINRRTDSRARIECIPIPLTMTSAARGRVL